MRRVGIRSVLTGLAILQFVLVVGTDTAYSVGKRPLGVAVIRGLLVTTLTFGGLRLWCRWGASGRPR